MSKPKFRRPEPEEQQVLEQLTVRPIFPKERARYDALMVEHHYLHDHHLVGEQLCYVITYREQWLALASWCAAARYLKARDRIARYIEENPVSAGLVCSAEEWEWSSAGRQSMDFRRGTNQVSGQAKPPVLPTKCSNAGVA